MLLAGDVGGTKTILALCAPPEQPGALPRRIAQATFASAEHPDLESVIDAFLSGLSPVQPPRVSSACFGVAGPVVDDRSETPNLPWVIDAPTIGQRFGFARTLLINDLVATAIRAALLSAEDVAVLAPGKPQAEPPRTRVVVAAGTGLGVAQLVELGGRWHALPSEGGHVCFAPRNALEVELLELLQRRYGRVSLERAVSGAGLAHIYELFRDSGRATPSPEVERRLASDPESAPRWVSEAALADTCPASRAALELFVELYGAAAGNFALVTLAMDGVFLGGGIAPKILPALERGRFLDAFVDKGRFRPLMETIPVYVIEDPETALLGAAIEAGRQEAA